MYLKRYLVNWLFGALMIFSLFQTYALMRDHFTHVDDIGVANTLMMPNQPLSSGCLLRLSNLQGKLPLASTLIESVKDLVCALPEYRERMGRVSDQWTYAPFQYWIAQFFLDPNQTYTYEEIKLQGRLPSFIFFIIGITAFFYLVNFVLPGLRDSYFLSLALTGIILFSLEQRIMASQMESYAIGLLANVVGFWGLLQLHNLRCLAGRKIIGSSLAIALAISMQYQAILLAIAGFIAILFFNRPFTWILTKKYCFCLGATIIFSFGLIGDITHLSNRGVSWNKGINGIFMVHGDDFLERALSLAALVFKETPYNLYSIISPIELNNFSATIFGEAALILCLIGLCYLYLGRRDSSKKFLLIFFVIYIGVYLIFVFAGKLTYSPTRHLLFYLPPVIICMGYGVRCLLEYFPSQKIASALIIALFIIYSLSLINFNNFYQKRVDVVSTENLKKAIKGFDADFIFAEEWGFELRWLVGDPKIPFYRHLKNASCGNQPPPSLHNLKIIRFITYSKYEDLNLDNSLIKDEVKDIVLRCLFPSGQSVRMGNIRKIESKFSIDSNTEVDLSNKTKNGTNGLYVGQYEISIY